MAKINSYDTVTPAHADMLLGTDVSDTTNDVNGETANFLVSALRHGANVMDYGATGDGTTDDAAAIQAAIDANQWVYFPPGTYAIDSEIVCGENHRLTGAFALGSGASIIKGTSGIATTEALFTIGRSTVVEYLRLTYDSSLITGSEAANERVAIETYSTSALQRGSTIRNCRFHTVGTAISDRGLGTFSASFRDLEIAGHSYAGIYLTGTTNTGCMFDNIYIVGDDAYASPSYGIYIADMSEFQAGQINIEHQIYDTAGLYLKNIGSFHIGTMHLEGLDTAANNQSWIVLDGATGHFESLNVYNMRHSYDNTFMVEFENSGRATTGVSYSNIKDDSEVHFEVVNVQGLANPDATKYPTYAGNTHLSNTTGFQFFGRDAGYAADQYYVFVGFWNFAQYTADSGSDAYYDTPLTYSNANSNITFKEFDGVNKADKTYDGELTFTNTPLTYGTTATNAAFIVKNANAGTAQGLLLTGGTAFNLGAAVQFKGNNHTDANDIVFQENGNTILLWDDSLDTWNFQAKAITTTGNITGGGIVFPSHTATAIADVGDAVNTANKVAGKGVWDTTNNRLMIASGSAAADAWYVADASTSVTPA